MTVTVNILSIVRRALLDPLHLAYVPELHLPPPLPAKDKDKDTGTDKPRAKDKAMDGLDTIRPNWTIVPDTDTDNPDPSGVWEYGRDASVRDDERRACLEAGIPFDRYERVKLCLAGKVNGEMSNRDIVAHYKAAGEKGFSKGSVDPAAKLVRDLNGW